MKLYPSHTLRAFNKAFNSLQGNLFGQYPNTVLMKRTIICNATQIATVAIQVIRGANFSQIGVFQLFKGGKLQELLRALSDKCFSKHFKDKIFTSGY